MLISSILLLIASLLTAFLSTPDADEPNYAALVPLFLIGASYSLYGPIIDSIVPYMVPFNMLGTAFGMHSISYSVGLFVSPLIAGKTLETDKDNGYFWTMMYFAGLQCICCLANVLLYVDDHKNREGILSKAVDQR